MTATSATGETLAPASPALDWFHREAPRPYAAVKLVCLPHAGGGTTAFRGWSDDVGPDIEVLVAQLPGRERRARLPPLTDREALLEALVSAVRPELDRPYALYGHSLGAALGFELARRLRRVGAPAPLALHVASRRAPHLPSPAPDVHRMDEPELVAWLARAQGTAPALLDNQRWLRHYLPTLRADLALSETYLCADEAPLPCPLFAYGGNDDQVLSRAELAAWAQHTRGGFSLDIHPGGHLFALDAAGSALRRTVARRTLALLRGSRPRGRS